MSYALSRQASGLEASTSGRSNCSNQFCAFVRWHLRHAACQPSRVPYLQRQVGLAAAKGPTKQHRTELPTAENAKIKKSVYVSSSVDLRGCPPQDFPEFAVIGRSNVGKSSLINMLTQKSKLAKVSKEPGRSMGSAVAKLLCQQDKYSTCWYYCVPVHGAGYPDERGPLLCRHDEDHQPLPRK